MPNPQVNPKDAALLFAFFSALIVVFFNYTNNSPSNFKLSPVKNVKNITNKTNR